jgi:hypothetical protein
VISRSPSCPELRDPSGFAGERTTGNLLMPEAEALHPRPLWFEFLGCSTIRPATGETRKPLHEIWMLHADACLIG